MEVQTAEQQGSPVSVEVWQRILKLQPRMAQANVQVGFSLIESGAHQREGIVLLTKAISPKDVDEPFPLDTLPGRVLASTIARWHIEMAEVYAALPILEAVSNIKQNPTDLCLAAMSATLLHVTPDSIQTADKSIARYLDLTQRLIQKLDRAPEWRLDEQLLSSAFPGAAADPFVHCMNSLFSLSFYYRADVAQVANRHYQIASRIWPKLNYVTKKSKRWMTSGKQKSHKKRIHIGIASGCISLKHSVSEDFKGTFSRLDREKFHITYIFIKERQNDLIDPFVYQHTVDTVMILEKTNSDFADGAWITRYHPIIESLDLDILFFPDLIMSSHATRLAYAKLAPVQATSHGHPMTSGIPKTIMDYYISWGSAELEYDIAKMHYTEELKFLPTNSLHQFYTPRSNQNVSLQDGGNYRLLVNNGRSKTFSSIPPNNHWYACMQKPHKLFPEMDELLCQVLDKDPLGLLILHIANSEESQQVFVNRLTREGCDMNRIHFLDALPHHRLLALYSLSDVILDSYPAGGCTTTREVLEIGKAVVTLPARFLGSRWSYAYYQMMRDEELNTMVVAQNSSEYVNLAVQIGTSVTKRTEVEARIKLSNHKLYERWDSVTAWEDVFIDIAPVTIDSSDGANKIGEL
eukprot:CAMPEP_0172428278 /NCGR_PEP_ID=MMETSP1064-20121228/45773_1 /TAXON_ID=202472 /ORGANISM="Aulacoseira subarctica , Strain CCAP 1002/5" /LENGTH=634 /DNA_ID=CAMNT_0013172985 /DNA_START=70 /DNA_END=1974 /DNA_ORIENTATION=+